MLLLLAQSPLQMTTAAANSKLVARQLTGCWHLQPPNSAVKCDVRLLYNDEVRMIEAQCLCCQKLLLPVEECCEADAAPLLQSAECYESMLNGTVAICQRRKELDHSCCSHDCCTVA